MKTRFSLSWGILILTTVLLLAGCGATSVANLGPRESLPGNDASGRAIVFLHNDGTTEQLTGYTIRPDRFRQGSGADIAITSAKGDKVLIVVNGHEFYVMVDQPLIVDDEEWTQMVRRADDKFEIRQLSPQKSLTDSEQL